MSSRLDPRRIAELEGVVGPDVGGIIESLTQSMSSGIESADGALAAGELERAAYVAHACRNDALMVGATQLKDALGALEEAARRNELEPSRAAMAQVRECWEPTLRELERARRRDGAA